MKKLNKNTIQNWFQELPYLDRAQTFFSSKKFNTIIFKRFFNQIVVIERYGFFWYTSSTVLLFFSFHFFHVSILAKSLFYFAAVIWLLDYVSFVLSERQSLRPNQYYSYLWFLPLLALLSFFISFSPLGRDCKFKRKLVF